MPETIKLSRSEQSRINGAKSRGPATPEGKAISSRNAIKHGFAASVNLVLGIEDSDEFHEHLAGARSAYKPRDYAENNFVNEMAAIEWRKSRLQAIETGLIDAQIGIQNRNLRAIYPDSAHDDYFHLVKAWQALAHGPQKSREDFGPHDPTVPTDGYDITSMELLRHYQDSLGRQFRNTLLNFQLYRKTFAPSEAAAYSEPVAKAEPVAIIDAPAPEPEPEPAPEPAPAAETNEPETPPPPKPETAPAATPKPVSTPVQTPSDAISTPKPVSIAPIRLVTPIKKL